MLFHGLCRFTAALAACLAIAGVGPLAFAEGGGGNEPGACCDLNTGECSVTTEALCTFGIFTPAGVCDPNPCPRGACCDPISSMCRITGPTGCFSGPILPNTTCEPNPCPGACCNATNTSCSILPQAACSGTWMPGSCSVRPCVGACCDLTTGLCALVPENICGSGLFVGRICEPNPCPRGACCDPITSMCRITGPTGCFNGPILPNTTCDPNPCPGACCSATGTSCTMLPQAACNGTWMPGSCSVRPCIGACCNLTTGDCALVPENTCGSGLFFGRICEPNPCPRGACCDSFTSMCRITGPTGCFNGPILPNTTCEPNPCPGACCSATGTSCSMLPQAACNGTWMPGSCSVRPCIGACCNLTTGDCALVPENSCSSGLFFGRICEPNPCPRGACCDSFTTVCRITGPTGCFGGPITPNTTCEPNPCPAACCDGATGLCQVIPQSACNGVILPGTTCQPVVCPPVARCKDLTFDATSNCISLNATPEQINNGSFTTQPNCPLTFSLSPSGPYPVGDTTVTLTVTDCNNRVSTCAATVHVLGEDCNSDGIPDICQCLWQTGEIPGNGQISHFGGGTGDPFTARGSRVADDISLCPGQVYRVFKFCGFMITNIPEPLRKARLQLFEDCNGAPAGEPIFTADSTDWIANGPPDSDGFTVVKFTFDLCDEHLWLDGGKSGRTYWWSLIGLGTCDGQDLSSWAIAGGRVAGSPPVKSDGVGGSYCYPTQFNEWRPLDECCIGCVNMAFNVYGAACPIIWDNGAAITGPSAGGIRSENLSSNQRWRGADDLIAKPCADQRICLIDAWVWSSCNPVQGFLEFYRNDCKKPGELFVTLRSPTVIPTGETATIQGVERRGYILRFEPEGFTLPGNQTWWLSAGADRTGSQNARTYFALGERCDRVCEHIGMASQFAVPPLPLAWTSNGPDLAFRIAAAPVLEPVMVIDVGQDPACRADIDHSGTVTLQDLFDFLSNWFDGCP